jgi:hypothetical protein
MKRDDLPLPILSQVDEQSSTVDAAFGSKLPIKKWKNLFMFIPF